ncbi:MAG: M1 family metallopeptidase [Candidatus Obscuribacterales bacterium]|nr:M1 family metallopeptidase [Candidatus Obscuribacterales bacterium]
MHGGSGRILKRSVSLTLHAATISLLLASMPIPLSNLQAQAVVGETVQVKTEAGNPYQLPKTAVPHSYALTFAPNFETFTFEGKASIKLELTEATDAVTLNALDLQIKRATLVPELADSVEHTGTVALDAEHEQARIAFGKALPKGMYELRLEFSGTLNDNMRGFYRSYFKDKDGNKRWLATTQMEPTDARRMFPCFDEPEMKATFGITAEIPADMVAISNGAVASEKISGGRKTVVFESSPKMSSYLVALIIGDFKSTSVKQACGIPIRLWAPVGKESLGAFALDAAAKVLQYQTDYFGIPYPGKKLDLIAIPDFRSGAMENLGAITFREAALLVDEKTGSTFLKRRVANIVAHEIAHQWFGDLVTMKWWDDIWLNEAFASWMATKTVDAIFPAWHEVTRSVLTRNESMGIDQLKATRAIHAHVDNPKQAAEMFDPITYDKGESVLRMLEVYVGAKKFQAGIHDYLKAHEFGNASSQDLWQSIGNAAPDVPVSELMKTWVFQPGFPVVTVDRSNGKTAVSQERFFGMPGEKTDSSTWKIPLVIRAVQTDSKSEPIRKVIGSRNEEVAIPSKWKGILVNAGGMGFYRTRFSPDAIADLMREFDQLTPEERLSTLADVSAQVWNASLPVEDKLNFILKVGCEQNPLVLTKLVDASKHPHHYMDAKTQSAYEKLLRTLLLPVKNRIGWNPQSGEDDATNDLRESTLWILGTYAQDPKTISEARALYKKFMGNHQSIPSNIIGTVLSIVAYNGTAADYEEMASAWKKESIPELEKKFLYKLAEFRQPELVDKTLMLVIGPDVRSQDGFKVLAEMLARPTSQTRAWEFTRNNWKQITEKFPPRSLNAIAAACASFDRPEEEQSIKQFFAENKLPYGKAEVSRMLEVLHASVLYRQRNEEKIRAWVTARK